MEKRENLELVNVAFENNGQKAVLTFLDKERAGLEKIATAYSTKSGIKMDVITDCIGMQLYTANFIQGQKVQGGAVCKDRDAFCLETQYFPNSINEPNFTTPLTEAGKSYDTKTVYAFSIA